MLPGRAVYDGPWRLFDFDPATGRTQWVLHEDGLMHIRTDYPTENLVRDNAEAHAEAMGKRWGDLTRVASIPPNIYYGSGLADAVHQGDQRYVAKFLNDSDNAAWRTRGGTV